MFEALALSLQGALELRDALPFLRELLLQFQSGLCDFIALRSKVNARGADRAPDREHAARHEHQPPQVRARDGAGSLELHLVRELPRAQLLRRARLDFEPHAFDFSLADGSEPRLLFAFRAGAFRDLELALPRRFLALPGEPFGRFCALALASALLLELGFPLAFHTPALLAHQRFQRK